MRIIWSPLALSRVSEAANYIAADNPSAAEKWVVDIFASVERISKQPRLGRMVPEVNREDIRELIFGAYRIIYRVESARIFVLTVRHGRRLLEVSEALGER